MKSEMKLIFGDELLITNKNEVIEHVKQRIDEHILKEVDYILKHNVISTYLLDRKKLIEYKGLYIRLIDTCNGNGIKYPTVTYQIYKPTFATIKEELYDELHSAVSRQIGCGGWDARMMENNSKIDEERYNSLMNGSVSLETLFDLDKPFLTESFIESYSKKLKEYKKNYNHEA